MNEEDEYIILEKYINGGASCAISYILENFMITKPTEAAKVLFEIRAKAGGC